MENRYNLEMEAPRFKNRLATALGVPKIRPCMPIQATEQRFSVNSVDFEFSDRLKIVSLL